MLEKKSVLFYFLFFNLIFLNILSAANYVKGSARFSSKKEDSLRFIKSQLLAKSIENIIGKELKQMGHDSDLFWKTYNEKYEQYFLPILDKLKTKYKMNTEDTSSVSKKSKKAYYSAIRVKKLKLRTRYGRLDKVIGSYAIVKMSRSARSPNSRYMKIKAVVNRKKLNKLYFKFIRTEESRFYKNLFVSTDFQLTNLSWSQLGVEVERDLKQVVTEHWKTWLEERLNNIVGKVVLAQDSENQKLEERYKIPINEISMISKDGGSQNQNRGEGFFDKINPGHMLFEDPTMGSLWLKITIKFDGKSIDELLKTHDCHIKGDFVLIDMNNNQLVDHFDFIQEEINLFALSSRVSDDVTRKNNVLSSKIAGMLYQLPMERFSRFPKVLSNISNNNRYAELLIKNIQSMKEVYRFNKLLQDRGVIIDANLKVSEFSKEITKGVLSYKGEPSKLISILAKLEGVHLFRNRVIKVGNMDRPFNFEIQGIENINSKKELK